MPQVGFEPTAPVSERAKTVHGLDRAVTVIGIYTFSVDYNGFSVRNHDASREHGVSVRGGVNRVHICSGRVTACNARAFVSVSCP
jgi:hypothetical protein